MDNIDKQLAAAQLQIKTLREALENHSGNYKLSKAECVVINQLLDAQQDLFALHAYGKRIADAVEKLTM